MTVSTHQTPRSQSLVASNRALLLGGGLALLIISWLILEPAIEPQCYRTAGLLLLAALTGLALRGLRRMA